MKARHPFVFIHPDTGIETTERRGEPARLLHALNSEGGGWREAFDLAIALYSLEVHARMNGLNKTHGPNLIHKREGRMGSNGRRLMEYRINPDVRVVQKP